MNEILPRPDSFSLSRSLSPSLSLSLSLYLSLYHFVPLPFSLKTWAPAPADNEQHF